VADIAELERMIGPEVKSLGFDLVRVMMIGGISDPTLQVMAERPDTRQLDIAVMAERPDTRQLDIADCEIISRRLSDLLDSDDPIEGSYRLEVSSPGIDRPLTRLRDYSDWAGHEARIRFAEPVNGAKQASGIIEGVEGNIVRVATTMGERTIDFANIASAKLVLTDKLINATAPLSTEGADTIHTQED